MKILQMSCFAIYIFIAGPANASLECDPFSVEITTTPALPESPVALENARNSIARIPEDSDILLIGDSIFAGGDTYISRQFSDAKIWNFSVSADKVQTALWRLDQVPSTSKAPDNAFIFLGTNNLGVSRATACSIFLGLEKLVENVKKRWPETQVYILSILPRGADFKGRDDLRVEINKLIKNNPNQADYVPIMIDDSLITCGHYSKPALPENTMMCMPELKYQCINYRPDNIHLEGPGYEILSHTLHEAIIKLE